MAKSRSLEICLVRHGLAGKADASKFPDDDLRPLTGKGRKAFMEAARGLRALGISPARIFASPALRTLQTAEILARALGRGQDMVVPMPELHHVSSPKAALGRLARLPGLGQGLPAPLIVLVGHQPWLGEFLSWLVAGHAGARFHMVKGGACLAKAEAVKPGGGRLDWSLTQDHLRALSRS